MSMNARANALAWAAKRTEAEIETEIAECEAAPEWKGYEFDDIRQREWQAARLATLRDILEDRRSGVEPGMELVQW
jgi:hypothetical protein